MTAAAPASVLNSALALGPGDPDGAWWRTSASEPFRRSPEASDTSLVLVVGPWLPSRVDVLPGASEAPEPALRFASTPSFVVISGLSAGASVFPLDGSSADESSADGSPAGPCRVGL